MLIRIQQYPASEGKQSKSPLHCYPPIATVFSPGEPPASLLADLGVSKRVKLAKHATVDQFTKTATNTEQRWERCCSPDHDRQIDGHTEWRGSGRWPADAKYLALN